MKLRKILFFFGKSLPFLLIFAVICAVIFFPQEKTEEVAEQRVIRIWNVDTFEGGKGSRTAFLRRVARQVEKSHTGMYFLITSYTVEGAEAARARGDRPDILSFGIGLSAYAEESIPLRRAFSGGEVGENTLAYPWCRGEYSLFSLADDFSETGKTALSSGGSNLVEIAACLAGIEGEVLDSTAAYTGFLSGKYRYLLGTQRDVCRFQVRGVQVYEKKLSAYNDLYQYISVLSEEKREDCFLFLAALLSKEVQGTLSDIGMLPVKGDGSGHTVSVFSDANSLEKMRVLALQEGARKNLDIFLKSI